MLSKREAWATIFQSTPLIRGATCRVTLDATLYCGISIHAPHTRSDYIIGTDHVFPFISIHAPHTRSDLVHRADDSRIQKISIHAPHTRSDHALSVILIPLASISIHAPHTRSD